MVCDQTSPPSLALTPIAWLKIAKMLHLHKGKCPRQHLCEQEGRVVMWSYAHYTGTREEGGMTLVRCQGRWRRVFDTRPSSVSWTPTIGKTRLGGTATRWTGESTPRNSTLSPAPRRFGAHRPTARYCTALWFDLFGNAAQSSISRTTRLPAEHPRRAEV